MINYANQEVHFTGCPGCAYARHEFELPCGMAFENDRFTLSQDWELPIPGFFIVSPKRCVDVLSALTKEERDEMFEIVDRTIRILKKNQVCEHFNVLFEEKEGRHLHVWIMPRHEWMKEVAPYITDELGAVLDYALANMKTEENYKKIDRITEIVRREWNE